MSESVPGYSDINLLMYNETMPLKHKLILFVLFGVIAAGIAFAVTRQNKRVGPRQTIAPTPSAITVEPPPRTINFPPMPTGASFVYSGPTKQIPSAVSTYRYTEALSPPVLNGLADSLSTQFNIQSTPSAIIEGQSFMYTRNDKYRSFALVKTKDIVSVTYQRILVEDSTMVLKGDSSSAAVSFFSPLASLSGGASFYALLADAGSFEGVVILERPIPPLKNYLFGISIQNVPILTKEYTRRWASLTIDNNGAVRILNYIAAPTIIPLAQTPVIQPAQAVQNLNAGRGAILWITQTTGDPYGVTPSFVRGVLTDFSLVYIHKNGTLVPAYLFNGEGVSPTGAKQAFEALVLAATPQL